MISLCVFNMVIRLSCIFVKCFNVNFYNMNKLFLLLTVALIGFSCNPKGEFEIKGTATSMDGKKVYLVNAREDGVEKIDTMIIENGKFSFKGIQEIPTVYFLSLSAPGDYDNSPVFQTILIEPSKKITVEITPEEIRVGGTEANEAHQKRSDDMKKLNEEITELDKKYSSIDPNTLSDEEVEKIRGEFSVIDKKMKELNLKYILDNINNPLGESTFLSGIDQLSVEEMSEVMEKANDIFKNSKNGTAIRELIEKNSKVAVGQKFTDFKMPDINGKEVALSDYAGKGKYVLIDFWASWCGPCMKEIPTLVNLYKSYKDKNFEIVGVSLDKKENEWKDAVKKMNMTWPQMSEVKGWDTVAREIYNFNGIPHTILLDPNGIIIAKDLRGKELEDKIRELVK